MSRRVAGTRRSDAEEHVHATIEAARAANSRFVLSPSIKPASVGVPVNPATHGILRYGGIFQNDPLSRTAPLMVANLASLFPTLRSVTLIDGRHFLVFGNYGYENRMIAQGKSDDLQDRLRCVNKAGSMPIIVWTMHEWMNILGPGVLPSGVKKTQGTERLQQLSDLLAPIRGRSGLPLLFVLADYDERQVLREGSKKDNRCHLPGMVKPDKQPLFEHRACEIDDALFTALHCAFNASGFQVLVASGDYKILKSQAAMEQIEGYVDEAVNQGMEFHVSVHQVPLAPTPGSPPAPMRPRLRGGDPTPEPADEDIPDEEDLGKDDMEEDSPPSPDRMSIPEVLR